MWKFIIRRILIMIPQLFVLSIIMFALAKAMPGDALTGLIGPNMDPSMLAEKRKQLGLDDPMWVQYGHWVKNLFHGNLGLSFIHKIPVTQLLGHRIVNSAILGAVTLFIAYLIAIPLGIIGGRWNNSLGDKFIVYYNYLSFAMPIFVFALFLLFFFGFILGIFPTGGSVSPDAGPGIWSVILSKADHLVLPAFSLALVTTAGTIQFLRNEVIDTKMQDFVKTARSKGVPESRVYSRHILRNSLLPIAAFMGYEITNLVGGSVFIESIFSYPGMGQLFLQSIDQRDFPVVTAIIMILGLAALLGTLLSDIIMSILDPRIRID